MVCLSELEVLSKQWKHKYFEEHFRSLFSKIVF